MPNIVKNMARQNLATSEGTLYTVPTSTSAVVTNIVLTNTTAAAIQATIKLATVEVLSGISIAANGILALDIKQVLAAGDVIAGSASATGLRAHISGMEIS